MKLLGLNGNAFTLLGAFKKAAREQGCPGEEVSLVVKEATSGDYNHLLQTLLTNTKSS